MGIERFICRGAPPPPPPPQYLLRNLSQFTAQMLALCFLELRVNLTLNEVVRPWGAGRNLNDFLDRTNTTKNFQKKRQASDMPGKKILKSCHSNPKTSKSARAET